jgi:hypothetical protein
LAHVVLGGTAAEQRELAHSREYWCGLAKSITPPRAMANRTAVGALALLVSACGPSRVVRGCQLFGGSMWLPPHVDVGNDLELARRRSSGSAACRCRRSLFSNRAQPIRGGRAWTVSTSHSAATAASVAACACAGGPCGGGAVRGRLGAGSRLGSSRCCRRAELPSIVDPVRHVAAEHAGRDEPARGPSSSPAWGTRTMRAIAPSHPTP